MTGRLAAAIALLLLPSAALARNIAAGLYSDRNVAPNLDRLYPDRLYWEARLEAERKAGERAEQAEREQRMREGRHANSFAGAREQAEKEFREGELFPDDAAREKMPTLKRKAEALASAIDWVEVERIYKRLVIAIETARGAMGPDGKRSLGGKEKGELLSELQVLASRLKTCFADYAAFSATLADGRSRDLFNAYFDEAASASVPRTFTHTSRQLAEKFARIAEEIDGLDASAAVEPIFAMRYRGFQGNPESPPGKASRP